MGIINGIIAAKRNKESSMQQKLSQTNISGKRQRFLKKSTT